MVEYEEVVLEDDRALGQTAKSQGQLMDRNLALLIWRSGLPSFVKDKPVPLTGAWCRGWGLPSLLKLWAIPPGVTPRGLGMPEPPPIWHAHRSGGDILDKHSVPATSASAFSVVGAGMEISAYSRMVISGPGLGSGSRDSGSGIASWSGSLATQMPPSRTHDLAAGINLVVT